MDKAQNGQTSRMKARENLKLVGVGAALAGGLVSATWAAALWYAASANPAVVRANTEGVTIARDSVQRLAESTSDVDARQDGEITRLSSTLIPLEARTDSVLTEIRLLSLTFRHYLCITSGRSASQCASEIR